MEGLKGHRVFQFQTSNGTNYDHLDLSYELYGQELHSAPVVLVIHALTGNSDLISEKKGWWKEIVGSNKLIDLERYTVIAINILGNGYDDVLIDDYENFMAKDIAKLFKLVLEDLNVEELFAAIGGSLGGGIAWEMAALYPDLIKNLIPIAADWKSSDWIIGHNSIQESILKNSNKPLQDARKMAMLFYRTPKAFKTKFGRTKTSDGSQFNVASWLNHHGEKLENRYHIKSYLMMNQLLSHIDISLDHNGNIKSALEGIKSKVIQISVDSDLFFVKEEAIETKKVLDELQIENEYYEIRSDAGHDAFLIEHNQITEFLTEVFSYKSE